jgi:ribosomal protein L11 methyltransferase
MSYVVLEFSPYDDIDIAYLVNYGADSFQELEDVLQAYFEDSEELEFVITSIKEDSVLGPKYQSHYLLKNENWNKIWESNFDPVEVGEFCRIRAEFHESKAEQFSHELVIQPKMAFGTGHHETTYMMVDIMSDLDFKGKKVFDYGCGTGILAILAAKLGAGEVHSIDIEQESYENTLENAETNDVADLIEVQHGTLDLVARNESFDIVLANINRNVLIDSVAHLRAILKDGGILLLSGLLSTDFEIIDTLYREHGFLHESTMEKSKWIALVYGAI